MEVSVTFHAGADARAGSSCPALVLPHLSSWCCPCSAHHPTPGTAPLAVPVLAAPQLSLPVQEPCGTEATNKKNKLKETKRKIENRG